MVLVGAGGSGEEGEEVVEYWQWVDCGVRVRVRRRTRRLGRRWDSIGRQVGRRKRRSGQQLTAFPSGWGFLNECRMIRRVAA